MRGFGGEGEGGKIGGEIAERIGGGIVVIKVWEEGAEDGASFGAGPLVGIGLSSGGDCREIGVPPFGVVVKLAEEIGRSLDDVEGGKGFGSGIGGEGIFQGEGNGNEFGLGGLVCSRLAKGVGLRGKRLAKGAEHLGQLGNFVDITHKTIGVANSDEMLDVA